MADRTAAQFGRADFNLTFYMLPSAAEAPPPPRPPAVCRTRSSTPRPPAFETSSSCKQAAQAAHQRRLATFYLSATTYLPPTSRQPASLLSLCHNLLPLTLTHVAAPCSVHGMCSLDCFSCIRVYMWVLVGVVVVLYLCEAGPVAANRLVTEIMPRLSMLLPRQYLCFVIVDDRIMSGRKRPARLLTCAVCDFKTYSKGGFVWHQRSAHGREDGNGIPGSKRRPPADDGTAAELDGIPTPPRARRRVDHLVAARGRGNMPGVAVEKEADGTLAADEVPVGIGALVADDSGSYDVAIRAQLYPLLELTGVLRDNVGDGGMHAEYQYQSLATRIFSLYEVLDDAARSVPILERRKNSRTGRFNTTRLGALQQFVLGVGGAGLSVREQKQLYDFLEIWDRRDAVDPMETRDDLSLSAVFPTVSSFTKALRDDLDDAVLSAGWKKLKIREGGTVYEVYYRSVLEVVMARLQKGDGGVRLWSGEDGPAPPTNMRQTPMDGDAFRLCEKEVVATHGGTSFVLGLHLYSDSSQLSWSGGAFMNPLRGERPSLLHILSVVRVCPHLLLHKRLLTVPFSSCNVPWVALLLFIPCSYLQPTNCTQCGFA